MIGLSPPPTHRQGSREWVDTTQQARISTLYGFNTVVVVVGLLQVVVLMIEAFPFHSMLCHGVHYFPHWMTR